ncbi:unnamed protein product [Caenorhabditis auriculariae]|uniref:Uncharacterized protein n=1 Tax=Caenorhabditis auriculariae TaxID=2777116 RepID=A0A8S1HDC7_9PELO|nr:unnamed protein product [Caenorhabditis auriculariae]
MWVSRVLPRLSRAEKRFSSAAAATDFDDIISSVTSGPVRIQVEPKFSGVDNPRNLLKWLQSNPAQNAKEFLSVGNTVRGFRENERSNLGHRINEISFKCLGETGRRTPNAPILDTLVAKFNREIPSEILDSIKFSTILDFAVRLSKSKRALPEAMRKSVEKSIEKRVSRELHKPSELLTLFNNIENKEWMKVEDISKKSRRTFGCYELKRIGFSFKLHRIVESDERLTVSQVCTILAACSKLSFHDARIFARTLQGIQFNANAEFSWKQLMSLVHSFSRLRIGDKKAWDTLIRLAQNIQKEATPSELSIFVGTLARMGIEDGKSFATALRSIIKKQNLNPDEWLNVVQSFAFFGLLTNEIADSVLNKDFVQEVLFKGKFKDEKYRLYQAMKLLQINKCAEVELTGYNGPKVTKESLEGVGVTFGAESVRNARQLKYGKGYDDFECRETFLAGLFRVAPCDSHCKPSDISDAGILIDAFVLPEPDKSGRVVALRQWGSRKPRPIFYFGWGQSKQLCSNSNEDTLLGFDKLALRLLRKLDFRPPLTAMEFVVLKEEEKMRDETKKDELEAIVCTTDIQTLASMSPDVFVLNVVWLAADKISKPFSFLRAGEELHRSGRAVSMKKLETRDLYQYELSNFWNRQDWDKPFSTRSIGDVLQFYFQCVNENFIKIWWKDMCLKSPRYNMTSDKRVLPMNLKKHYFFLAGKRANMMFLSDISYLFHNMPNVLQNPRSDCPVCYTSFSAMHVFECGHLICNGCFIRLRDSNGNLKKCHVCQQYREDAEVTISDGFCPYDFCGPMFKPENTKFTLHPCGCFFSCSRFQESVDVERAISWCPLAMCDGMDPACSSSGVLLPQDSYPPIREKSPAECGMARYVVEENRRPSIKVCGPPKPFAKQFVAVRSGPLLPSRNDVSGQPRQQNELSNTTIVKGRTYTKVTRPVEVRQNVVKNQKILMNSNVLGQRRDHAVSFPVKIAYREEPVEQKALWTAQRQAPIHQNQRQNASYSNYPQSSETQIGEVVRPGNEKNTTQYGITSSYSKESAMVRVKSADIFNHNDYLGDDFKMVEDDDEWIENIDVTSFKDISNDLKQVKKLNAAAQNRNNHQPRFPKPTWSYSSLIALALKNSETGQLTVSEIYAFILENFPYFRTAPSGWKNSVRHNLSLNKCFQKVETDMNQSARKACLWMICAQKAEKLEADIRKWKDKGGTLEGLARPQDLLAITTGTKGLPDMESYAKLLRNSYDETRAQNLAQQQQALKNYHQQSNKRKLEMTRIATEERAMQAQQLVSRPVENEIYPLEDIVLPDELPLEPPIPEIPNLEDDLHIDADCETLMPPKAKRPFSDLMNSPVCDSLELLCGGSSTPTKLLYKEDSWDTSPFKYSACYGSFEMARDAFHDNSLLTAAAEASPYKGSVTFPIIS